MTSPGLMKLQIDCALIHLRSAKSIADCMRDERPAGLGDLAREVQIAIDRLEDRWI